MQENEIFLPSLGLLSLNSDVQSRVLEGAAPIGERADIANIRWNPSGLDFLISIKRLLFSSCLKPSEGPSDSASDSLRPDQLPDSDSDLDAEWDEAGRSDEAASASKRSKGAKERAEKHRIECFGQMTADLQQDTFAHALWLILSAHPSDYSDATGILTPSKLDPASYADLKKILSKYANGLEEGPAQQRILFGNMLQSVQFMDTGASAPSSDTLLRCKKWLAATKQIQSTLADGPSSAASYKALRVYTRMLSRLKAQASPPGEYTRFLAQYYQKWLTKDDAVSEDSGYSVAQWAEHYKKKIPVLYTHADGYKLGTRSRPMEVKGKNKKKSTTGYENLQVEHIIPVAWFGLQQATVLEIQNGMNDLHNVYLAWALDNSRKGSKAVFLRRFRGDEEAETPLLYVPDHFSEDVSILVARTVVYMFLTYPLIAQSAKHGKAGSIGYQQQLENLVRMATRKPSEVEKRMNAFLFAKYPRCNPLIWSAFARQQVREPGGYFRRLLERRLEGSDWITDMVIKHTRL